MICRILMTRSSGRAKESEGWIGCFNFVHRPDAKARWSCDLIYRVASRVLSMSDFNESFERMVVKYSIDHPEK